MHQPGGGGHPHLLSLPDALLDHILSLLPVDHRLKTTPLVCKKLRDATRRPSLLWRDFRLDVRCLPLPVGPHQGPQTCKLCSGRLLAWLGQRGGGVRSLALMGLDDFAERALHDLHDDDDGEAGGGGGGEPPRSRRTQLLSCCASLQRLELEDTGLWPGLLDALRSPTLAGSLREFELTLSAEWGGYKRRRHSPPALDGDALSVALGACAGLWRLVLDGADMHRQYLLRAWPEFVTRLAQLEVLHVTGIRDDFSLPASMATLSKLRDLKVAKATLAGCEVRAAQLDALTRLALRRCYVAPGVLGGLLHGASQLRALELESLRPRDDARAVRELPPDAALASLCGLEELAMRGLYLTELPAAVTALTQLGLLDASRNHLERLPEQLTVLRRLRVINVDSQMNCAPLVVPLAITRMEGVRFDFDHMRCYCNSEFGSACGALGSVVLETGPEKLIVDVDVEPRSMCVGSVTVELFPSMHHNGRGTSLGWGTRVESEGGVRLLPHTANEVLHVVKFFDQSFS